MVILMKTVDDIIFFNFKRKWKSRKVGNLFKIKYNNKE